MRARFTHIVLPHFFGVPPAVHEVPSAAAPRLAVPGGNPGLTTAVAPSCPLCCVMLRIASALYDGLHPAALFGALGGAPKEPVLVLAPDVDVRTRRRLLVALADTGVGLEPVTNLVVNRSLEVNAKRHFDYFGSIEGLEVSSGNSFGKYGDDISKFRQKAELFLLSEICNINITMINEVIEKV